MQTIYEASILLVDDNPDLLVLVGTACARRGIPASAPLPHVPRPGHCLPLLRRS